jgi:hypothetical protein
MYAHQDFSEEFAAKFDQKSWLNVENNFEDYTSRAHINRKFLQESLKNMRKYRSNKKNNLKGKAYTTTLKQYSTINNSLFTKPTSNNAYHTGLPNTVKFYRISLISGYLHKPWTGF